MSSTIVKISITLEGEDNWFEQIDAVETTARKADIWEYINPELVKEAILVLVRLIEPQVKDFFEDTDDTINGLDEYTLLRQLTPEKTAQYLSFMSNFDAREKRYRAKRSLIEDMRSQIQGSINKDFYIYTTDCDTIYDILVNLRH